MLQIGLTGNIGSGKSTVASVFSALEVPVFVSDIEAKKFYNVEIVIEKLKAVFGNNIYNTYNEIDKIKLGEFIFNDNCKMEQLTDIIYPLLAKKYNEWLLTNQNQNYIIYESAIIFEKNLNHHFNKIINVETNINERIARVMKRDGFYEDEIRSRMKLQWDDAKKSRLSDFVIYNNECDLIVPQIIKIHNYLIAI